MAVTPCNTSSSVSRVVLMKSSMVLVDHVGTEHTRVFREVAGTGETLENWML